jgi:hypothetical protein
MVKAVVEPGAVIDGFTIEALRIFDHYHFRIA